jgi:aryl-alcohol dehydrogenase-like predicted oxidoreductase
MKKRALGPFQVGAIGLGCMNLSHAYGVPPSPETGKALLHRALDLGIDHFDTAALYGFGRNEELVGPTLKPFRSRITLASKCGMTGIDGKRVIDGRPASLKRDCEDSLRRLQTDVIDLYTLHRWDKSVPIEDSVGALADLVREGKIRAIGLSEVSAETLEKAHKIHRIAAVQSEYSLWTRNPEIRVLESCHRLGVAFVAFSPLGRGFLTGLDLDPDHFAAGDIRCSMPRFQAPHFAHNGALLPAFRALAADWGMSPAQLALAWVLHRGDHILPIPGTTSLDHLEDDVGATSITLDAAQMRAVEELINGDTVSGPRYPRQAALEVDTEEE